MKISLETIHNMYWKSHIRITRIIFLLFCGVFVVCIKVTPVVAANDIAFASSTIINVGGTNLTIFSTSTLESLIVRSSDFDMTFVPGSSISLVAYSNKDFTVNSDNPISFSKTCGIASSTLVFTSPSILTKVTVGIAGLCTASTVASPQVISGGGYPNPPSATSGITSTSSTIINVATSSLVSVTRESGFTVIASSSPQNSLKTLSRPLGIGSRGSDVLALQKVLFNKTTLLTKSDLIGVYGTKTEKAVKAFQCAEHIVCSGTIKTTGWGKVGTKTLKALENAVILNKEPITIESGTSSSARVNSDTTAVDVSTQVKITASEINRKTKGQEVRALQMLLHKAYPAILSDQDITGTVGPKTESAIKKFQCAHKIVCSGNIMTTGWGHAGKTTIEELNKISQ